MIRCSDPASGTEVSYRNDGTANTGYVSGQVEPLGQSVALTDPEPPNEPSTYEQHLFFASEPEWQCNLPASFQPVSCSIRAEIASAEVDFGLHLVYDPDKRPGDPNYIQLDYDESLNPVAMSRPILYSMLKGTVKPRDIQYGGGFKAEPDSGYPAEIAMNFYLYLRDSALASTGFTDLFFGNPSCISNAVEGGSLGSNNIKPNFRNGNPKNGPDGTAGHDGIHVQVPLDTKNATVTALPAMAGILKAVKDQGDGLYRLDILLDAKIGDEKYYLILKDLNPKQIIGKSVGRKNLRIKAGDVLGSVNGGDSKNLHPELGEMGLHVTMISASNYPKLVTNIRAGIASPIEWFMDAARDPLSPFTCP